MHAAMTANRLGSPVLTRMRCTWSLTVAGEMHSRRAMSLLLRPSAISSAKRLAELAGSLEINRQPGRLADIRRQAQQLGPGHAPSLGALHGADQAPHLAQGSGIQRRRTVGHPAGNLTMLNRSIRRYVDAP